jgi:hypothetical protein
VLSNLYVAHEFSGRFAAEFGMRPDRIVVVPGGTEDRLCVAKGCEHRFVEAFVPQSAVEAIRRLRVVLPLGAKAVETHRGAIPGKISANSIVDVARSI